MTNSYMYEWTWAQEYTAQWSAHSCQVRFRVAQNSSSRPSVSLSPANEVCEGYVFTGVCRIFTAHKRSLRRLCFHRCLSYLYRPQTKFAKVMFSQVSVCPQGGGCAWPGRGIVGKVMHGTGHAWQGACMAGRHAWQGACVVGACMAVGGMHGRWGGMCGRGHVWQGGHVWHTCPPPWQILWDTVNERVVRILLECIFVCHEISN